MTRLTLRFPVASFGIEGPPEVVREVVDLYPWSADPAAPPADESFRVTTESEFFLLEGPEFAPLRFRRPLDVALSLALALERAVLARRGERPALHAGAVGHGGRAWLVAGEPETGKTSSVFHLIELGCDFLCEEIAILDPDDRVLPFPQPLELGSEFLAEVKAVFRVRGELAEGPHGHRRYRPPRRVDRPLPVGAIVLPRYRAGKPPRVARRPADEALIELLGHCFEPLGDEERFFERMMVLAEATPILELTYPDARTARQLLRRLLTTEGG